MSSVSQIICATNNLARSTRALTRSFLKCATLEQAAFVANTAAEVEEFACNTSNEAEQAEQRGDLDSAARLTASANAALKAAEAAETAFRHLCARYADPYLDVTEAAEEAAKEAQKYASAAISGGYPDASLAVLHAQALQSHADSARNHYGCVVGEIDAIIDNYGPDVHGCASALEAQFGIVVQSGVGYNLIGYYAN
jgi:hypothetical protein